MNALRWCLSRKMGRVGLLTMGLTAVFALGILSRRPEIARGDDSGDSSAATQPSEVNWQRIVRFYGDESSGAWSLRIDDVDVPRVAKFHFLELWRYDRDAKNWVKTNEPASITPIVLPADKPADSPPKGQMLVVFGAIAPTDIGLYYAKWQVDDEPGGTYIRIGPGGNPSRLPKSIPAGMIADFVPITQLKTEPSVIPDPRLACNPPPPPQTQPSQ